MIVAGNVGQPCGVQDYAFRLAGALSFGFSDITVISPAVNGLHRVNVRRLWSIRRKILRQSELIPQGRLVHVQYSDYSWNGVRIFEDLYELFSRKCRSPLVMTIHEHPWFRYEHESDRPNTWADFIFSWLAGYWVAPKSLPLELFSRHLGIHVHHEWQKMILVGKGVPEPKVRVIPISIPECIAETAQVVAFRHHLGFQHKQMIVMAGFVLERKRYDRIIELLPDLPSDVVVCALGGEHGPASEKYIRDLTARACVLGVSDRFVVTGYLPEPEMNAGLLAADVFVAPYGEVTSSASVARCIGAGAPIVAGKGETFEELAADGAGLVVVDPDDKDEMKRVLLGLLEKKSDYQALRQKNLDYAAKWSLSKVASDMQAWYRECLKR